MAEEDNDVKFCSNCQKDIAARNFLMHEAHCSRNIILCPECKEPVPRLSLEEHKKEYHVKVACEACHSKIEKCNLEDHKSTECPRRPIKCQYCEIEVEYVKLKEHVEYCGSRTETCPICQKNIMIKDLDAHEAAATCETPFPPLYSDSSSLSSIRNRSSPPPLIEDRPSLDNSFVRDELARVTRIPIAASSSLFQNFNRQGGFPDLFSQSGRRDLSFDTDEDLLLSYQMEGLNRFGGGQRVAHLARPQPRLNTEKTVLPCEFCGSPFNSNDLQIHQLSCENKKDDFDGHNDHITAEFSNTVIPCEFCNVPFSEEKLAFHQADCGSTPRYADSTEDLFYNSTNDPEVLANIVNPGPLPRAEPTWSSLEEEEDVYQSDSLNAEIECEFCQELFPIRFINEHELNCNSRESPEPVAMAATSKNIPQSRAVAATKKSFETRLNGAQNESRHHRVDQTTVKGREPPRKTSSTNPNNYERSSRGSQPTAPNRPTNASSTKSSQGRPVRPTASTSLTRPSQTNTNRTNTKSTSQQSKDLNERR